MVAHGSMPKTEKIPLSPSMRAKTDRSSLKECYIRLENGDVVGGRERILYNALVAPLSSVLCSSHKSSPLISLSLKSACTISESWFPRNHGILNPILSKVKKKLMCQ